MSKPMVHAESTAKRLGGKPEDYLDIHVFLDESREAFPDLRHRALTHNSYFLTKVLPRVFGENRKNSEGKTYSVRDVGEHHVYEDFGGKFIPSAQDFLAQIEFQDWMDNGRGTPPSHAKLGKWLSRGGHVSELELAESNPKPQGVIAKIFGGKRTRRPKPDYSEEHVPGDCGGPGVFD